MSGGEPLSEERLETLRDELAQIGGEYASYLCNEERNKAQVARLRAFAREIQEPSREYVRLTDPLITCSAWVHGGERDPSCGECRCCWIERATEAERAVNALAEALGRGGHKADAQSPCVACCALAAYRASEAGRGKIDE